MPDTRLRAFAIALICAGLVAAALLRVPLWRAAYPYLPRQLQALPYRLSARLAQARPTPLPVPSPVITASSLVITALSPVITASTPNASAGITSIGRSPMASPTSADATARLVPSSSLPSAARLMAPRHEYQTWNNCGPATLGMALGALGATLSQEELAAVLKPDPDDKNVSPDELAAEAGRRGYRALVRVGGTMDNLRSLMVAGFPVVVESWFIPEPGDEMGHYLLLVGYDDATSELFAHDSFHGPNQRLSYETFDGLWRAFNRSYVVFFAAPDEEVVRKVLGDVADDKAMWTHAATQAAGEVASRRDAFASFNLGSSLLALGEAKGAADAFDNARVLGLPWRFLWYQFGPFEAYAATERWSEVQALAEASLDNADNLEESHYWRGRALAAAGKDAAARAAFQQALALNPNYAPAKAALANP